MIMVFVEFSGCCGCCVESIANPCRLRQLVVQSGPEDDKSKGAAARGRPDEPVPTKEDQNLAQKLYKNLEAHARFLVEKKDRVRTLVGFSLLFGL